jgi:NADH:ubiquinone oxidoreductase subunit 6 (subunit J)
MNAIHWHSVFFLFFALLACASAVAVVVTTNIVRMACFLVMALGAVAGLFFLAGAEFVGAVQLMVYVGGTLVLLVFGVMLTARGPFVSMQTGAGQWILATIISGGLLAVLLQPVFSTPEWMAPPAAKESQAASPPPTAATIGMGLMGVRVDKLSQPEGTLREGMSGYLLAFEVISVHLVVALVGAAYLARARRTVDRKQSKMQAAEISQMLHGG